MESPESIRKTALDAAVRMLAPNLSDLMPFSTVKVSEAEAFTRDATIRLAVSFEEYLREGAK